MNVGILATDYIKDWKKDAIETLTNESDVNISVVILPKSVETSEPHSSGLDRFVSNLRTFLIEKKAWGWYWAGRAGIRKLVGRSYPQHRQRRNHIDDIPALADAEQIRCEPIATDGFGVKLPEEAVSALEQTDFAVRFAFGFIKGDSLTAPTYGVLSFHHGDIRTYRGKPAGFWEFMNNESEIGITLQRITETLDGGEVVVSKSLEIPQNATWQDLERLVFTESDDILVTAVNSIADQTTSPDNIDELGPVYTNPTFFVLFRYLIKNNYIKLRKILSN
jgi:hypothetical protein